MTKKQYQNSTGTLSTLLAIGSFLIGTSLLILFLTTKNFEVIGFGIIYLLGATAANLIMLFRLIYLLITHKNHQEYYTIKILILLANIPIAFVYFKIVAELW